MPELEKKRENNIDPTKSSVDVELTFTAFKLPKVVDPPLEKGVQGRQSMFPELPAEIEAERLLDSDNQLNLDKLDYKNVRKSIDEKARVENTRKIKNKNVNFTDIVEVDYYMLDDHVKTNIAARFVDSQIFRLVMFIVILLNSVMIGMQTDESLDTHGNSIFQLVDHAFLGIFIMEIMIKWYTGFWDFWKGGWNWFDLIIVTVALVGPGVAFLSDARTMRVLRVLRTLKTLRSVESFQGLQMVVNTIMNSIPDMINIGVLLILLMFIWSVLGVTLFGQVAPYYFGSMGSAMFSMFIATTQDGWVNIVNYISAKGEFAAIAVFMSSFVIVAVFFVVNMIVAVVTFNYNEAYEEEEKRKKTLNRLFRGGGRTESILKLILEQKVFERPVENPPPLDDPLWKSQFPFETLNFDKISDRKIQNYFTVLSIIEENIFEYLCLKQELQELLDEIKSSNVDNDDDGFEVDIDDEEDDDDEDEGGDILSRMMRGAI